MASIITDAQGVRNTFSSWDNCMSKAYCKWPAIVGIIIASVIVLSIIWCVASCLCCGASLCGACVKCLTCGSCCGVCSRRDGGGHRNSRHKEDYSRMPPTPYQGYQPQPNSMQFNQSTPMQYNHAAPQFATFDAPSKKINEDALPAMPSWENARSRKVEDHTPEPPVPRSRGDDLEMGAIQSQRPQQRRDYEREASYNQTLHPQRRDRYDQETGIAQLPKPQRRDGYDQVPMRDPMSPTYDAPYDRDAAYNPDLGAQRLAPNPRVSPMLPHEQLRAPAHMISPPISPSPTFRTISPMTTHSAPYPMDPRRFSNGPISPPIPEHHVPQYNANNYSTYSSTEQSTRYEPSENQYSSYRGLSPPPPTFHTIDPQEQQGGNRPPSLLQVGRKPVNGF